jgi:hypothetical protein
MVTPKAPGSFDEASQRFSIFLHQNGYPEKVLWLEQANLVWDKRRLWVRDDPRAPDYARRRYADAIGAGFGVNLHAFAVAGDKTVAGVIVPVDDDGAQRHLIPYGGLKLSALKNMHSGRLVSSRPIWLFRSLLHRESSRLFFASHLECA